MKTYSVSDRNLPYLIFVKICVIDQTDWSITPKYRFASFYVPIGLLSGVRMRWNIKHLEVIAHMLVSTCSIIEGHFTFILSWNIRQTKWHIFWSTLHHFCYRWEREISKTFATDLVGVFSDKFFHRRPTSLTLLYCSCSWLNITFFTGVEFLFPCSNIFFILSCLTTHSFKPGSSFELTYHI